MARRNQVVDALCVVNAGGGVTDLMALQIPKIERDWGESKVSGLLLNSTPP